MAEESAFGYDEMTKQTFYGMRAHLRVCWPGVIVEVDLAPANVHDLPLAEELLEDAKEGWALGDRNYWSPKLAERLGEQGLSLLALTSPRKGKKSPGLKLAGAKAPKDRDGDFPDNRALPGQKGLGTRSLAPNLALAAQGVEPHYSRLLLPASRAVAATLC